MKDYEKRITHDSYQAIIKFANENNYEIEIVEGTLNDAYIIYNPERTLEFDGGVKGRKYVVVYPKFETHWSNSFHLLLTDSESKVKQFNN